MSCNAVARWYGVCLVSVASLGASFVSGQPVECAYPGNQIVNCGFDADLSGWSLALGEFTHQDGDGFPQPGSLDVASVPTPPQSAFRFEQVVPNLPPAGTYEVGIDVRVLSGTPEYCVLSVNFTHHSFDIHYVPTGQWTRRQYTLAPVGQTSSALFRLYCANYSGQPFSMRFDDALLRPVTWGANLGVALGSCTGAVTVGGGVQFGATVHNQGPEAADVDVVGTLPGECRWTCAPGPGAFCTTGPVQATLADAAYIPAGEDVTYEATCLNVNGEADVYSTLSATVVSGVDPFLDDNTSHTYHHVVAANARPYVKGDLTGDMQADLLLRHQADWTHTVWEQIGSRRLGDALVISPAPSPPWLLEGVADFDGDRQQDLVFRDPTSGAVQFWLMNGVVRRGAPQPIGNAAALGPQWQIAATGDFNRDGQPDLLWRSTVTGKIAIWTMHGWERVGTLIPTPDQAVDSNWEIVAALDYDDQNDAVLDLLWYNTTSGKIVLWLMDDQIVRRTGFFTNPPNAGDNNWRVLASADYGIGPGGSQCTYDLVWRNANSGKLVLWYMDHAGNRSSGTFTSPAAVSPDPTAWTLVGPR